MTIGPLLDARIYAGPVDLSGQSNKVDLAAEVEELDRTVFKPANPADRGWRQRAAGQLSCKAAVSGLWAAGDPGAVDDGMWAAVAGRARWPWTFVAGTQWATLAGDLAYFTRAVTSKYQMLGDTGALAPFEASVSSDWPAVRGVVAHPPGAARTAPGVGAGLRVGALGEGQRLYAALHVLSVTDGAQLDVVVESGEDFDDDAATRLAFTPATAAGGQILRTSAGPHSDDWYRVSWTVTGGSVLFLAALGIE